MARTRPPEPGLPTEKLLLIAGLGVGVIVFMWGFASLMRRKAPVAAAVPAPVAPPPAPPPAPVVTPAPEFPAIDFPAPEAPAAPAAAHAAPPKQPRELPVPGKDLTLRDDGMWSSQGNISTSAQ